VFAPFGKRSFFVPHCSAKKKMETYDAKLKSAKKKMTATPITETYDAKLKETVYHFSCPHCDQLIEVPSSFICCTIFRHALLKTGGQFNPHASRVECEDAVAKGLVHGCGKPFVFTGKTVVKSDYC
jgi:hypothetical protein